MTTDTNSSLPIEMRAETGFELDEEAPPLRVSGFISLLFGLLSILCLLGKPLLVLPLIAIFFAAVALRGSGTEKPVGTRPAMIGLVLAIGLGSCGFFLPWMKQRTLGNQAEQFSRDFMEVMARGHFEIAIELRKDYVNRLPSRMSLAEFYASNERASESLMEMRYDSVSTLLQSRGPDANWVLDRPVRIYHTYGKEQAEVVWIDPTGETDTKIQLFLNYVIDRDGDGQWNVDVIQPYRERLVAESVL